MSRFLGPADSDLKHKFRAANRNATRRSESPSAGLKVPESPIAKILNIEVSSTISEADLQKKIQKHEEERPGFMRASYKGCCMAPCTSGFPKFYKRVLGSMLNEAQKKSSESKQG